MGALRNAAVFMAVVLALALVRFFRDILSPLVVAAFMLMLVDGVSRAMQRRLPGTPAWLRGSLAGAVIVAAFSFVAGLFVIGAPPFATDIHALLPKLNLVLARAMALAGAPPITLQQILSGLDTGRLAGPIFGAARHFTSYGALVFIFFGFLAASRTAFSRKAEQLYETPQRRESALRVATSVSHAVDRYTWLQTLKALLIGVAAWLLMTVLGVKDAVFVAFLVFLSAYVPIVGAVLGSVFPGLLALSQFSDVARPLLIVGVLASAVFVIDNVIMPKWQGDELNLDPLFILISLGFWAAILGAPGVILSTPLTVAVMAIAAEFRTTRWVAVLLSRDGRPGGEAQT